MKTYRISYIAKTWEPDCALSASTMGERLRAEARRLGRKQPFELSRCEALNALSDDKWVTFPPCPLGNERIQKRQRDGVRCVKCGNGLDGRSEYLCLACYKYEITDFYNELK